MDELPDSSKFLYNLETKTAKKELRKVWKKFLAQKGSPCWTGYNGRTFSTKQKDFKGFQTIKEIKLTNTRMFLQIEKNVASDEIVAIFLRSDMGRI
jgi:hypothetical protein